MINFKDCKISDKMLTNIVEINVKIIKEIKLRDDPISNRGLTKLFRI